MSTPALRALIRLTVECQHIVNELGPKFEDENKSFIDALRGAQDVVNNEITQALTPEQIVSGVLNHLMSGDPDMPRKR